MHVKQSEDELFTETKKGQLNLIFDEDGFRLACKPKRRAKKVTSKEDRCQQVEPDLD